VLRHLNLSKTYSIRFFHPNESEEMFSLYFHLYETDKLFKTKISLLSLCRDIWDKTNDNENNENNEKSFIGNIMSMIQENNDVVPNEVSYEYSRDEQFKMSSAMLGLFSTFIPTVDIIPKDSDPKEYIKNQLSDTSSVLYLAMSAEFIKRKVYTQDIKLDVFVDDVFPNI
jgi:hypothetical protein